MFNYPRGSEWRKWDLHIHSTASDGNAAPAEIIDEARAKGLSVIALTDHHCVENIDEIKRIGKDNGITVISGIEFRTEYGAKSVHMIGLFPDNYKNIELNQKALNELILSPLNLSRTRIIAAGRDTDPSLSNYSAFKKGLFMVQVEFKEASDLIHKYGGIVSVHAGNKSNTIEQMKHDGDGENNVDLLEDSLGTVKEKLMKSYIDICEVQKCSEAKFYLREFGKPSIAASDAHEKSKIGTKYTWIKADPTFYGLLQIKFEPQQRVSIQEETPGEKASYSVIDYVTINNPDFSTGGNISRIPFNQDLTCIIGAKSTGKSLLLNNIAFAIDKEQVLEKYQITLPESKKKKNVDIFSPIEGFTVHWADGNKSSIATQISKKIVYIPQTYLNRLSDEEEETTEIDTIIENILLQDESIKAKHDKFNTSIGKTKVEIDRLIYDYLQLCEKISKQKEELLENNNSAFIKKEIENIELEQKRYISETITEEQSQKYNSLCEELQIKKKEITNYLHDKNLISDVNEIKIQPPTEFVELESSISKKTLDIINSIGEQVSLFWIDKRQELLNELNQIISDHEKSIEEINKEIESLRPIIERNAILISLSTKLSKEKSKLNDALKTEMAIKFQGNKAITLLNELINNFFTYKRISDEFVSFVNDTKGENVEGLRFSVETVLRCDAMRTRLLEVLNNKTLSKLKKIDITQQLTENLVTSEALKEIVLSLQSNNANSLNLKNQYTLSEVLRGLFSNWYNTNYVVKMDDDSFEKMSPGKKALILLKLLIGLANSDCPMLIDQPEDDLDNRSIFEDLVKYIKKKKIQRQIIIVTHNANIVVGADSDEIIVANRHGQNTPNAETKFEYVSGSIENSFKTADEKVVLRSQGIREHICEILEGGEKAFAKRKDKYHMGT